MKTVEVKCYRCAKQYDVADMRYAAASRMICKFCMGKAKEPIIGREAKKSTLTGFHIKNDDSSTILAKKIDYICDNCNYTFKRKPSADINICPYCSAEGTIEIKTSMAERLLRESIGEYDK